MNHKKEMKQIGLLYYCIHTKLNEHCGFSKVITKDYFKVFISRWFKIKTRLVPIIEREMIDAGLLENINRTSLEVLPVKIDIENNLGLLYRRFSVR